MKVLRVLRYCLLSFVVITIAVVMPSVVTKLLGGDVQQWKWFTVFYGALSMLAAMFFGLLAALWHIGLILSSVWKKSHG